MPTYTDNYDLPKPNVNSPDDEDLWGEQLNDGLDIIDGTMKAISDTANGATSVITDNYTITAADRNRTILVDATVGDITITANAVDLGDGFEFRLLKIDNSANTVIFDPSGGQTVNGAATNVISGQYARASYVSDATNWYVSDETVPLASAAETLAGLLASKAITPKGFADNSLLEVPGRYELPGGFMIQWGLNTPAGGQADVSFSKPYTTACFGVVACAQDTHPTTIAESAVCDNLAKDKFRLTTFNTINGATTPLPAFWISMGK